MSKSDSEIQEEKEKTLENVALAGAAAEIVQRYGSANKEFLVGYGGKDNETRKVFRESSRWLREPPRE